MPLHLLSVQHLLLAAETGGSTHHQMLLGEIDLFDTAVPTVGLLLLSVLGWLVVRLIKSNDKAVERVTKKHEETDKKLNEHITEDAGNHSELKVRVDNLEKQEDRRHK